MTQTPMALFEFVMDLFGDEAKAAEFDKNPGKCMADAGLDKVTPHEVSAVIPIVAQSVTPPGGGSWSPSVPSHGSPSQMIQQVVNNFYDQSIHNEIVNNGSGDIDVDVKQTNANGEGAVAVGGDAHGPIATTGGVAGTGNEVGNSKDDHSTHRDDSIHGDNSGNASSTKVSDNSRNDSHNKLDVTSTGAPAPMAPPPPPVPIPVDPFDAHGGIPFVPGGDDLAIGANDFMYLDQPDSPEGSTGGSPADNSHIFDALDPGEAISPDVIDGDLQPGSDGMPVPFDPTAPDGDALGISTSDIVPTEHVEPMVAEMDMGQSYAAEPAMAVAEAPVADQGDADF
ncbi:IniB N-terminal domain-containing protein [Nocardia sp. 348MFTsu5.1]|uniref:IniB N-terminal domain-containing protein n=1 Tax=Nocardia sp. 348MFTsu5.1 TaxID=1172185 RepID=UPI0003A18504|nr:IniB N-terminal domain-containing protein [Nocardia sp. 348MFTsu5.1]